MKKALAVIVMVIAVIASLFGFGVWIYEKC